MSNTELKEKIISRIQESENRDLLKDVETLLNIESEDLEVYKLTDEQKKGIDEAKAEIQNGKFISGEDSDKEVDKWLEK